MFQIFLFSEYKISLYKSFIVNHDAQYIEQNN